MLATVQSWLTAHPDLARVALATIVFLIVYLVRKLAPSLWLRFEGLSPALNIESEWLSEQLHKLYQALPSAVLGAILGPLMTGGDWRQALLGALNGLAAPLSHELLSRYQGKLGKAKFKSPPSGGDEVDDTISLMPEPVRLVAQDRSRLHNDRPDEPAEFRRRKHPAWRIALAGLLFCGCSLFTGETAKTAADIAHDLCVKHYSAAKPGVSLDDIAKSYCQDLDPWVSTIVGAEQLGAAKVAAKAHQ